MKPTWILYLLLHATLTAVLAEAPSGKMQQLTSPDQVPEGLQKSGWQCIRAAHRAWEHSMMPEEGGWQARNPGQQWTTRFDGRGFLAKPKAAEWQWGLELRSYGFGARQKKVEGKPQAVTAKGLRLSYQWDADVREWFINDQHGFTAERRPEGSASGEELDVVLGTRGTLKASVAADAVEGLKIRWHAAYEVNYRVRWSGNLKAWRDLTAPYTGNGAEAEITDPNPPAGGRFYRVEVIQAP